MKDIVVVGSQIRGSAVTAALPVTVLDSKQIDATGALSGDDLIRAIPQMGDVTFNPSNNPQTSNAARGDVNSINLRNLGVGNTLVLLNGRRLVSHPTSQAGEGNVPVLGYNSNSIPVAGVERLEILRDGARRDLRRRCRGGRGQHGDARRFQRPDARRAFRVCGRHAPQGI